MTAHAELRALLAKYPRGVMVPPLLAERLLYEHHLAARALEYIRADVCGGTPGPCFCGSHTSTVQG